jgi:peptidoglycan/xylan/chitin deacetylase (PgdA/CDA1 family)
MRTNVLGVILLVALSAMLAGPAAAVESGPYLPAPLTNSEWNRLPTTQKVVALTFDAGANADGLPSILSTLSAQGVPATFFLTGQWAQSFPAQAAQIAAKPSYAIGNHTFDHPDLTKLSDAAVAKEVNDAQAAIQAATGRDSRPLFRFPFGARDGRTVTDVNSLGYGNIRWSVDTLGWKGTLANTCEPGGQTVNSVVAAALGGAQPGEIILMHVGSACDHTTLDATALPRIIAGLKAQGYAFVSLADFVRQYRMDVFARGADGGVWTKWWDGSAWHAWDSLGGSVPQPVIPGGGTRDVDPAAVLRGFGHVDVFVRWSDNQLYHRSWDNERWSSWEALGGGLRSGPGAASWGTNRVDIFVRGTDDQLWHKWWDGTRWNGWEPLGGALTSAPAVTAWDVGRLDVFVRGTDGGLWWKTLQAGMWASWRPLGGSPAGINQQPAVAAWGPNRLDLFARATNGNHLWHKSWNGAFWSGWEDLGGVLTSAPTVASYASGHLDVFARGVDSQMWHKWWDGTRWNGWQPLGGTLTSAPATAA